MVFAAASLGTSPPILSDELSELSDEPLGIGSLW